MSWVSILDTRFVSTRRCSADAGPPTQFGRNAKLTGQLIRRPRCHVEVLQQLLVAASPTAFGDSRCNGHGSIAHLLGDPEAFR